AVTERRNACRERTISGFNGVVAVVDTDDHGKPHFLCFEQIAIYLQDRELVPSRVAKSVNEKSPASSNEINARYRAVNGDALLKSIYFYCVYLRTGRTNKIPPENFLYFCGDFFAQNRSRPPNSRKRGT
ncbi:hypothetical protein, partial [uncultured Subdoligranulum sp.]|uniref:hypothetical protein n=1 Tax=uncultured Subdoligranulum sp. TaxID=512298 RepID=UPI0025CE3D8C